MRSLQGGAPRRTCTKQDSQETKQYKFLNFATKAIFMSTRRLSSHSVSASGSSLSSIQCSARTCSITDPSKGARSQRGQGRLPLPWWFIWPGHVDFGVILPLCIKGKFYAIHAFVHKGKILRHGCRYVHNDSILRHGVWRKIPLWNGVTTLYNVAYT